MQYVLISGGSGLVGQYLTRQLYQSGYEVGILTRGADAKGELCRYHHWNPAKGTLDPALVSEADHIVNLAGANLGAKRWNKRYKQLIYNSRITSTRLLAQVINAANNPPKTFSSASAVNYYGIQRQGLLDEQAAAGTHFLSKVCVDWEQEANQVDNAFTRVVIPRLATVLAPEEGAFPQMKAPVEWGAGAPLGSGKQRTPWIHVVDLAGMLALAMTEPFLRGPFNAASPEHTTNEKLMRTIAQALHKPFILPNVPSLALKAMIGEFADVLMTDLQLDTNYIRKAGFEFQYPDVASAVAQLRSATA